MSKQKQTKVEPIQQKDTSMEFLPEGYVEPSMKLNYMSFQEGENKFRILSKPIFGYEDWIEKRPVRYEKSEIVPTPHDPAKPVKLYWAMIVWNYADKRIQILQITQASIRKALAVLVKDEDWGAPFFYDIKVLRNGKGKETEYSIMPSNKSPTHPDIRKAFDEKKCDLEAFKQCKDPFALSATFTPGVF